MTSHSIVGIISSIALLIPIILIIALRLINNRSFLALSVYYFIVSIQNLMAHHVVPVSKEFYQDLGLINNLLDAPLMLVFLLFFSTSTVTTKRIVLTIFIFLGFEIIILAVFGLGLRSLQIILGPDILIIGTISMIFFQRNTRLAIVNSKTTGKAVMASSVLLSYLLFTLVYIFFYLVRNLQYKEDARLIYHLVTIVSALLMSTGLLIEMKRIKKLDELKTTRKELATIYGEKKAATYKDGRFLGASE